MCDVCIDCCQCHAEMCKGCFQCCGEIAKECDKATCNIYKENKTNNYKSVPMAPEPIQMTRDTPIIF
jgi:hypothetical protein